MTLFKISVISRLGRTHTTEVESQENEVARYALADVFEYIGDWNCVSRDDMSPDGVYVNVSWTKLEKNGRTMCSSKFYSCPALRMIRQIPYYTKEDLDFALIGLSPIFYAVNHRTGEMTEGVVYATRDAVPHTISDDVIHEWVHVKYEKERLANLPGYNGENND